MVERQLPKRATRVVRELAGLLCPAFQKSNQPSKLARLQMRRRPHK
jgi:hypothetical protein